MHVCCDCTENITNWTIEPSTAHDVVTTSVTTAAPDMTTFPAAAMTTDTNDMTSLADTTPLADTTLLAYTTLLADTTSQADTTSHVETSPADIAAAQAAAVIIVDPRRAQGIHFYKRTQCCTKIVHKLYYDFHF